MLGGMAFVAINVLTVPEGRESVLEERFARRAGSVERAEGFEHFELLRPLKGTHSYLVYTRWRTREAFEAWTRSQSFAHGHAQASARREGEGPAATGSTLWAFEVLSSAQAVSTPDDHLPGTG